MKNRKFIIWILNRYKGRFALIFILSAAASILSLFTMIMIEPFIKLLFRGNLNDLSTISGFVVSILSNYFDLYSLEGSFIVLIITAILLFFLKNLFQYLSQCTMAHIRSHYTYTLRQDLYEKIISLPLGFFNKEKRGDYVSRVASDVQESEYTLLSSIYTFLTEPVTIIFYLLFLFYIDYQLTLWSLLLFPIAFLLIGLLSHSLRKDSKNAKQRLGSLTSFVEETLIGYRVMTIFNQQGYFYDKYDKLNHAFHDKQRTIYRKSYLASPLSEFLGVSVVMAVLVIGGTLVLSERSPLSAELFITFIAIFSQLINPIKNLSTAFAEYKRGQAALDRMKSFISVEDDIKENDFTESIPDFSQSIIFNDVSFAYKDAPEVKVLSNINIEIKKGSTIAFVGESGAGKTTISDLLMRFYEPTDGEITYDGLPVNKLPVREYRSHFALVSQDVILFHDTFYNNITLGKAASMDEVVSAAKSAGIYDFIQSFPEGFEHQIGDMGSTISGGQRQKISIARAILRRVPIIILDEATSAMDTESERFFQTSIDSLFKDRTKVVIAHRLSTIANADCIYVIHNGEIVESGSHNELVANKSYYHRLLTIQNQ